MTALEPTPTALDERVLRNVPVGRPGARARAIASAVERQVGPRWKPPQARVDEVRLILRGFEHLGRVKQTAGWWRR